MNRPSFRMKLSEDQLKQLALRAKKSNLTPQEWLNRKATEVVKQILGERDEVDFKEAARILDVTRETVARYFRKGIFPRAVKINARVVRLPRRDVHDFKESRRVSLIRV